ncbi:MAG TPA: cupin domain-containing protein [Symbiobacteriaceae bacterium]|nr:cupin domain-containing protein [Symbiobacteriaceae bacterium]
MDFQSVETMKRFSAEKYQKVSLFETSQTAMDVYCLMPGQTQKLHSHKGTDKYYLVWEGQATVQIGDEIRQLGPGEAALARPGVDHSIANQSDQPVVAIVFQAPKSF